MHVPWRWVKNRPHFIASISQNISMCASVEKQYFYKGKIFLQEAGFPEHLRINEPFKFPLVGLYFSKKINPVLREFQMRPRKRKENISDCNGRKVE